MTDKKFEKEQINSLRSELQVTLGWDIKYLDDTSSNPYIKKLKKLADTWDMDARIIDGFVRGKNPHKSNLEMLFDKYSLNTLFYVRDAETLRVYMNHGQSAEPFVTTNLEHREGQMQLEEVISSNDQLEPFLTDLSKIINNWCDGLPCNTLEYTRKVKMFIQSEEIERLFKNDLIVKKAAKIYSNKVPAFMVSEQYKYVTQIYIVFDNKVSNEADENILSNDDDTIAMPVDENQLRSLKRDRILSTGI